MNIKVPNHVVAAILFLVLVAFVVTFAYGIAVQRLKLFPYQHVDKVVAALQWFEEQTPIGLAWYYKEVDRLEARPLAADHPTPDALNLVSSIVEDHRLSVRLIDMQGQTFHEWDVDVFEYWPNTDHLLDEVKPKTRPGTHIHGIMLLENGDLLVNHNSIGTSRLDKCGNVVWQLAYETHHSIHRAADGNFWISGRKRYLEPLPDWPLHGATVFDPTVIEVSPDGEMLREISVLKLLDDNDLRALASIRGGSIGNSIYGDNLHLNDVETFDQQGTEGVFEYGDVVISLRNINTILVFNPDTLMIKYVRTGGFIRQHDPDFVDANTMTLYDNNHVGMGDGMVSRILELNAANDEIKVLYPKEGDETFYSHIMGKHQRLDNGNMIIVESSSGRGFEIDTQGRTVWEFINRIDDKRVGVVEQVDRLPASTRVLFADLSCDQPI